MKFGVIGFPGSNGDKDVMYVLKEVIDASIVEIWHKDTGLHGVDAIVLPGGFSFGDYLRPGAIASHSPIMEKVIEFAIEGGLVFGIGNGFQILCEAGLLPGALLQNQGKMFICKNMFLKADNNDNCITSYIDKNKILKIPIAHGFGRYFAGADTLRNMRQNHQIVFRYCDENGRITEDANPDGSVENIAGICNEAKNIYGMMPHPERVADDELGNTDGRIIFESIFNALKERNCLKA
jgi:phosphoribosylformylglycinamidine synthase subunit PurQ / glutaminase